MTINEKGKMGVCIELKNDNYGSMLQSYATQKVLSNNNVVFDLIKYKKKITLTYIVKNALRIFNKVMLQDKLSKNRKKRFISEHIELKESFKKRNENFNEFRDTYFIAPIVVYNGYDELVKANKRYTSYLTGSDQLWSPSGLASNFYNLMFADENKVKISYASSFGVKKIPWYQISRTREFLNRIQFISCRENSGSDIVKELTTRVVPVVLDPTLLFTANEWTNMLPCNQVYEGKYILSYILGTEKRWRDEVLKLSSETGLPVISIHQYVKADYRFGDVSIRDAGPKEFVDLIRNAEYVCTDSFHGSVFSILYHKKFITFNRYKESDRASKNTRIDSLCKNFGLEKRRFRNNIVAEIIQDIDYAKVDVTVNELREKSFAYLQNALMAIKNL